jgi:tRNA dimethylallyltransferase
VPTTAERPRLIAIVGATATGKSALAAHLAQRLGGAVINADSRQVYRYMDIGTAKPTPDERAAAPHHLYDIIDPDEAFSLGRYLDLVNETLEECWSRGALPIVTGGTGQYLWALLEGWQVPRVPPDAGFRAELERRAELDGAEPLVAELSRVDPAYAARIDTRNLRRVIRALEVFHRTGRPLSSCATRTPPDFRWTAIGLSTPRDQLYARIDARVDAMMADGFLDEVRSLLGRGYSCRLPSMSGIGYRQLCQHVEGELSLEDAVSRIKTATHRLARMQSTWFRQDDARIRWLDAASGDSVDDAIRIVESTLTC